MKQRLLTILAFAFPCVVLLAVHYNALRTWFFMDDFAWLGLRLEWHTARDLIDILFQPRAQGTMRTLSERLFFLAFSSVFGMKAGPFHYWVFLTQCGSLVLANAIVRRLSGSTLAGIAAATAWAMSHATAVAMSWLSAYNEILCGFFMLAAFYCLVRFAENGERRFWILQWIPYLLGFLALEVTVVYPAVACVYLWLRARQHWRKALWLWIPALIFTAVHFLLIPNSGGAAYQMMFDLGMVTNLGRYALKAVGPSDLLEFMQEMPAPMGWWVAVGMGALLLAFLAWRFAKRDWMPVMGVVWFVFFLGPVLPLQNHFSDYYTTIASFGLAMLMGWAFQRAVQSGWILRIAVVAAVSVFAWCEVTQTQAMEQWYRTRSGQLHMFLNGVDEIVHQRHAEAVLLAGVDDELYISGLLDDPFRLYGIQRAYLMPGSESQLRSVPKARIRMRTDQDEADHLVNSGQTVVAAFDGRGVVDVTDIYKAMRDGRLKLTVLHTTDLTWSSRLGPGWHAVENGYRWMPRRATARLDVPTEQPAALTVSIFCPQTLLDQSKGPLTMKAWADGQPLGVRTIVLGEQQLQFDSLAPEMFQKKQLEIALEVSHTVVPPGDGRELGVPVFEIGLKKP